MLLSILTNDLHDVVEGEPVIPHPGGAADGFKERIKMAKELVRQETGRKQGSDVE